MSFTMGTLNPTPIILLNGKYGNDMILLSCGSKKSYVVYIQDRESKNLRVQIVFFIKKIPRYAR